jgi:ATP/ADP translocase/HEAT repeat protein
LFNVHTSEGKMVLVLMGLGFLETFANSIARSTTYALFLAEFDAGTLPYAYIGIAILATVISTVYLKLTERYVLGRVLLGNSAFITLLLLGLWLGSTVTQARWVTFSMPIAFGILNTLGITAYWGLIGRVLNLQQSKRLTGLLDTGGTIAFMLGGFAMPLLVLGVGAVNVLLVSAITMVAAWFVLFYVNRFFAEQLNIPPEKSDAAQAEAKPAGSVFKSGYIRLIFSLFTLFIIGVYFVDNTFYALAEIQYPDPDQLAAFVGIFWGVSSALILLMQAFVSGRLMVRYGVGVIMMLTPTVIAVETGTMALIGTIFGATVVLFWLAVLANISRVVLDATDQSAVNVLYQPLPATLRTRVQTMVNGIFYPISIGVAGLLLLLFRNVLGFDVVQLTYIIFLIAVAWFSVAFLLRRAYPQALLKALSKRDFGDTDYLYADPASLAVLRQGLASPQVGVVLHSLDLLEAADLETLPTFLPALLEHHTAEVRLNVLQRIERLGLNAALPIIKERFKYEGSAEVRGASLRVMAVLGGSEEFEALYPYLDEPDPRLKWGVLVGMLRSGEFEGIVAAAARLTTEANSANPSERIFAAQVLGESAMPGFYRPLLKLLHDENLQVQRSALVAAGKVQQPKLWPAVIDMLGVKALRSTAVSTLVAADKTALPHLEAAINKADQGHEVLIRLAQILGRIGGSQATTILQGQLDYPDELVRTHILLALNKCGYRAAPEAVTGVEEKIKAELAQAAWIAATLGDLGETETTLLLRSSLAQQLNRHRLRVLLCLSFIYDPQAVRRVQETLGIGLSLNGAGPTASTEAGQQKSYALETIDVLLPTNQKLMVLPLVEGGPPDDLLQRLNSYFPQESQSCEARLSEIITARNSWLTAWTKAAALYTVARLPAPALSNIVESCLESDEALIRETATWALFRLDPTQHRSRLEKAVGDPDLQVSHLAQCLINAPKGDKLMLSTVEKVMALKSLSFFTDTPYEVLVDVAAALKEQTVAAGATVFAKGEPGSSVYIIAEGEIRIHDGERTIAQLSENDAFGEMSILDPDPRSATATALKESHLLRLDQESFKELLTDHSEVAWRVMQILTQRLRQAQSQARGRRDTDDLLGSLKKKLAEN